ncbi:MAG: hypothetical protein ACJA0V_004898, partial [Planctomycetota bacterium]
GKTVLQANLEKGTIPLLLGVERRSSCKQESRQ